LNYHQTSWSEFLPAFDMTINFRPGKGHGNADALTCHGEASGDDETFWRPMIPRDCWGPIKWVCWHISHPQMWVTCFMAYYKLHVRVTPLLQNSSR
jgi:hypothetical protein